MSDEKTRIIPRKQADATAPRRVGDKIVFFCPNGDKIVVAESLAGKRGTCTKCKVAVVIPTLPRPKAVEPPTELQVAPDEAPAPEATEESPEEEAEAPALPPAVGPVEPPVAPTAEEWRLGSDVDGSHVGLDMGGASPLPAAWSDEATPESPEGTDHPAARLVARLWLERGHGGIVELHLAGGGGVILPEWYEPHWSRGTHGLFASQAVDGSVTLTAVAWDAIEKIVVRQVQGLPDGMFMAE